MTGKKMLDMILLGVMMLATLGVVGEFYWTEKIYKKPLIDENKEKMSLFKETDPKTLPVFYKLDKITISLVPKSEARVSRMHWLEIEVQLALFNESDIGFVKAYQAAVLDRIIEISSKMGPEELNTLSGKMLLEDRLKREINKALGKTIVKSIFFPRYIIQ
jgi:flagellar FliL protein